MMFINGMWLWLPYIFIDKMSWLYFDTHACVWKLLIVKVNFLYRCWLFWWWFLHVEGIVSILFLQISLFSLVCLRELLVLFVCFGILAIWETLWRAARTTEQSDSYQWWHSWATFWNVCRRSASCVWGCVGCVSLCSYSQIRWRTQVRITCICFFNCNFFSKGRVLHWNCESVTIH